MCSPTTGRARALLSVALGALFLIAGACRDGHQAVSPDESADIAQFASSSSLPHINNTNLSLPVAVTAVLSADECSNNPGPRITLAGDIALGGFGVGMTFRNNMKGTHEFGDEKTVQATVQPAGEEVTIPKQPVLGGTGGNPFIWIQFTDGAGVATTGEIFVGRCVQGSTWRANGPASTAASAFAEFEVTSCENSPGPFINMGSGLALAGMNANIIFRNNDNPVGGPHENGETVRRVVIIPAGLEFSFPKQPVLGGVGGNPWIWAGFTDGVGTAAGEQTLLGRCEQLSKALG